MNEELAQEAVALYPHRALPQLRTELRRMPSVWRRAVAADPLAIRWVLPEQCTLDVAWAALERDSRVFPFLPRWRDHRPFALFAMGRVGGLLRYDALATKWGDDEEVVRAAVAQNGLALEFASDRLRANDRVVKTALRQNGLALAFLYPRMRCWRMYVEIAVRQNHYALAFSEGCSDVEHWALAAGAQLPPLPSSQQELF